MGRLDLFVIVPHGLRILQQVPRKHGDDAVPRADHAFLHEPPRAGERRCARRLASNAGGIHDRLGLENVVVAHARDHAVRATDRPHGTVVGDRVADADGTGDRVRLDAPPFGESATKAQGERRGTVGLHGGEARHAVDHTPLPCLLQRFPEGGRIAEVARGQHDPVGGLPGKLL